MNKGGFAYNSLVEVEEEIPIIGRVKRILLCDDLCILWDRALIRQMADKTNLFASISRFKK